MKWLDAYKQIDKSTFTNREAAGVIGFARALFNTYAKDPKAALAPWDWYAFALPALGWGKPGDKFKIDTKQQLLSYPYSKELRASMTAMATELDTAGIPFRLLVDPRGTDKVFRKLATDAWAAMKQLGAETSSLPDALAEQWAKQLGPQGAVSIAASLTPGAAAAAKPPGAKEPEQMPLPGVPQVMPPPGGGPEAPTYEVQPVDMPKNGGGGAGILLLLAAFAFGRKKKRGRRR